MDIQILLTVSKKDLIYDRKKKKYILKPKEYEVSDLATEGFEMRKVSKLMHFLDK